MNLARAVTTAAVLLLALAPAAHAHHNALDLFSDGFAESDPLAPVSFGATDAEGSVMVFSTVEGLSPNDTDASNDVYIRRNGAYTLLSDRVKPGPDEAKHAYFASASPDADRVYFITTESLVAEDTDAAQDVYGTVEGITFLISDRVQPGADANEPVYFARRPEQQAGVILFSTVEPLTSTDGDAVQDVYRWEGGVTTQVSDGTGVDQEKLVAFAGVNGDGSETYFTTEEPLTVADGDTGKDLYQRSSAGLSLLSDRIQAGADDSSAVLHFGGNARDGSRVFFTTTEPLVTTDGDDDFDVYERAGTTTRIVSDRVQAGADGDADVSFSGSSADGGRVFFETDEPIVVADTDTTGRDVFERVGGITRLVSARNDAGPSTNQSAFFAGASDDGTRVAFSTEEPMRSSDLDAGYDVYLREAGGTWHVSDRVEGGPDTNLSVSFAGMTSDGREIFLMTQESLRSADTDADHDVYHARRETPPALASDGPGPDADTGTLLSGWSEDGSRLFLMTDQSLLPADTDAMNDVYVSYNRPPPPADPGGGPGGGDPGGDQPPAGDPPPPALSVALGKLAKSVTLATLRAKGLAIAVEPNLPASFAAELRGNRGLAKAAAGDVILAEGKLARAGGKRTLRVRVPRSQRKRLKRRAKLTLRIVATDALGRSVTLTRSVRIG